MYRIQLFKYQLLVSNDTLNVAAQNKHYFNIFNKYVKFNKSSLHKFFFKERLIHHYLHVFIMGISIHLSFDHRHYSHIPMNRNKKQ